MIALSLNAVRKVYGAKDKEFVALEDVTLQVLPSELLAIVGPSGSGKSTLLQIAAGLLERSEGSVLFNGQPLSSPPAGLIYLFQQYGKSLLPWRNVIDNVMLPLELQPGLGKAEAQAQALDYLEMVGLRAFARSRLWELSGGMQQRVAIARALAAKPSVLLLDEPFSAVDALTRIDLQQLVLNIWKEQQLTIVLVTHDVEEAVYMASRIAILSKRPTVVEEIVETGLPYPRDPIAIREAPRFAELRHYLMERLLRRAPAHA